MRITSIFSAVPLFLLSLHPPHSQTINNKTDPWSGKTVADGIHVKEMVNARLDKAPKLGAKAPKTLVADAPNLGETSLPFRLVLREASRAFFRQLFLPLLSRVSSAHKLASQSLRA